MVLDHRPAAIRRHVDSPANSGEPITESPADHPGFRPGVKIADKYLVERLVGEGGLGVVVAAKHLQLDQTVAIKYLRPRALAGKGVAERFLREARLAARMRSDHAVHVYDVGTLADGSPYMVMELLVGTDLGKQLMTSGPLTVERAIDYVLQACEALAEAHVVGIVHRDIKPDNLFVATKSGGKSVLKILDFGISKMSAKRATPQDARSITEAGDKFGTPVYMSPEQLLASETVDARADVWAMGVVFYELLSGAMPFEGDSLPELCTAILNKPPVPLLAVRPTIPPPLAAVIERCLEKDAANRFQNVAELAQELVPFVQQAGQDRIEHIVRIVEGGGETVRLSTPAPRASYLPQPPRDVSTLMEQGERATTGSGVSAAASIVPATALAAQAERTRRTRMLALGASALLAIAVGVASLTGRGDRAEPAGARAAAAPGAPVATAIPSATPEPAAPVPALVDVEPAASSKSPDDSAAAAPAAAASSAQASASGPPAPVAPAATRHGPKAPAKGKAGGKAGRPDSSHFDPNAVLNPFE